MKACETDGASATNSGWSPNGEYDDEGKAVKASGLCSSAWDIVEGREMHQGLIFPAWLPSSFARHSIANQVHVPSMFFSHQVPLCLSLNEDDLHSSTIEQMIREANAKIDIRES